MFTFAVALTLDYHTPHEYLNLYDGRLGILTVLVDGVLHRVGKVTTPNREELAICVCRQLGYQSGVVVSGPWLRLADGIFSQMRSWCQAVMVNVLLCSTIVKTKNISEMAVDIFFCQYAEECRSSYKNQFSVWFTTTDYSTIFSNHNLLSPVVGVDYARGQGGSLGGHTPSICIKGQEKEKRSRKNAKTQFRFSKRLRVSSGKRYETRGRGRSFPDTLDF